MHLRPQVAGLVTRSQYPFPDFRDEREIEQWAVMKRDQGSCITVGSSGMVTFELRAEGGLAWQREGGSSEYKGPEDGKKGNTPWSQESEGSGLADTVAQE